MKNLKFAAAMTVCCTALMMIAGSEKALSREYKRSCEGYYIVKVTSVNGVQPSAPVRRARKVPTRGFSGRGSCSSYTRINACRRRARDFCHNCMKAHWRNPVKKPRACNSLTNGLGVNNYNIINLRRRLRNSVCSDPNLRGRTARYDVYRVTRGDKGCGPRLKKTMRRKLGSVTVRCRFVR
ncbi:MAG: hypothetical protein QNJ49_05085 [Mastigocoleus sp. MO_167.B18]|uniref:hypothetical protein n=1 Tax=Mastigocoleus sp. MO_188.B34 TaxID=3036635 RepID=UPI00261F7179|nr:hypothetical protein [Mastigocoleus sp. MO_188.B34]MDJ0693190.1 hypothetical protein [Mastigocoleus sp. MO_188.B34]MDJ0772793.1 hypothetical protein [Mastigocoleus sp. MO_167.B18]